MINETTTFLESTFNNNPYHVLEAGMFIGMVLSFFIIIILKLFKRKKKYDLSNIRTMIVEANKEMNSANNKLIELNKTFEELENV